ncbi:tetratricopeptide repeat protein 27 [Populus alba x Populus x berolinensis]|nr:tetratricopeptide repeat protein 27 [Populus alba x Populus x berolinensis]
MAQILRGYELRLLRCTLATPPPPSDSPSPCPPSDPNDLHSHINFLLTCIQSGNYLQALFSDSAKLVTASTQIDSTKSPDRVYSELVERVEQFIRDGGGGGDEEDGFRVILVICVAIAAFFCFIQGNITGPVSEIPECPLLLKVEESIEWDSWARNQLISDGAHLLGKFSNLECIVFAKMLVMKAKDLLFEGSISSAYGIRSISWWLARVLLIEQRILDELSSSLFDLLQVSMGETLRHFGTLEHVANYWGDELGNEEAADIVSTVHLEAGIMEQTYGHVDSCRLHLESAEVASGIQLSLTGVLGYRTVHQVEPKQQRLLVVDRSSSHTGGISSTMSPGIKTHDSTTAKNDQHEISQASDIHRTPVLLETGEKSEIGAQGNQNVAPHGAAPLKAVQQAVILARCLLIEISSRHDELQRWDMAPFIETIDSQPTSFFTLRCFCDLLRIRWEKTRTRTKQRALEMMEKLVEGMHNSLPGVAQRIPFCYVANIPTIPALRKEHGELLISCGLMGEAITIFESLELWDNLIYCYCLLEKKAAAVQLIKKRLSEMPNDPRLWCSLGDVTNDDSCYEKALEVSNNKSARAKRSLARSAYNRGDYETSKIMWEAALALNSLYPDGWFALGSAALKARDVDKALVGFTKAVQFDPENGEAWNNIACLHMLRKRSEEAFIAFNEALKFKRDSWQMWAQFSHVALDVGNVHKALEAVRMVLNITSGKATGKEIDADILERIMLEIEERISRRPFKPPSVSDDTSLTTQHCPDDSHNDSINEAEQRIAVGRSRETEQLVELLGKILQQIVKRVSRADIWGLYARWHKLKGDLTMCSEALLKQVRSYQGSDLWKDRDRFKLYARASLELCKVYMEISSSTGSHRELSTAEMHLKNIVRQAGSFSDTEEFKDVQACLDEVKKRQSD